MKKANRRRPPQLRWVPYWGFTTLLAAAVFLTSRCGSTSGNHSVTIAFGTYTAKNLFLDWLIPNAFATVSSAKFCFKRFRFKYEASGTSSDNSENIDFQPGEISLSTSGTTLGEVSLPEHKYTRIEFDLEKDGTGCTSGKSAQVSSSTGSFQTDDRITVKFDGSFTPSESNKKITLAITSITSALDAVTSNGDIKTKLEAASGSF